MSHHGLVERGEWPNETQEGSLPTDQGKVNTLKIRRTYFQRGDRAHVDQLPAPSQHPCGPSWNVSLFLQAITIPVMVSKAPYLYIMSVKSVCTCVCIVEPDVLVLVASHNDGQCRMAHHLVDLGVGCTICANRK